MGECHRRNETVTLDTSVQFYLEHLLFDLTLVSSLSPSRMRFLVVAAAFLAVASAASLSLEDMEFHAWKMKFGKRVSFFSFIYIFKILGKESHQVLFTDWTNKTKHSEAIQTIIKDRRVLMNLTHLSSINAVLFLTFYQSWEKYQRFQKNIKHILYILYWLIDFYECLLKRFN